MRYWKKAFSIDKPSDEQDKCLRPKARQQQKLQEKTFSDKQKLTYIITPIFLQNRSNDLSLTSDDSTFSFEAQQLINTRLSNRHHYILL